MDTLVYRIIRHLADSYDITEAEAIGLARWLLSLQFDGESSDELARFAWTHRHIRAGICRWHPDVQGHH
jgi:hypothetical protein